MGKIEQIKGIDKAAEESATKEGLLAGPVHNAAVRTFKAGAKWMAEQGETHEMEVLENFDGLLITDMGVSSEMFNKGDKVIVQIRKA